jgi:hypothetical protein
VSTLAHTTTLFYQEGPLDISTTSEFKDLRTEAAAMGPRLLADVLRVRQAGGSFRGRGMKQAKGSIPWRHIRWGCRKSLLQSLLSPHRRQELDPDTVVAPSAQRQKVCVNIRPDSHIHWG